jgi:hypothetical protein
VLPERERRFLGCIRLSLAALYQAEVMDGVFKVKGGCPMQLWPFNWQLRSAQSWHNISPSDNGQRDNGELIVTG